MSTKLKKPEETMSSRRRWLVLAVMSVGTLIVFIDNTVVNTALPAISVDLGASISTLQWVVDGYVLVLAGLLLLGGSLGDRYGRKKWIKNDRQTILCRLKSVVRLAVDIQIVESEHPACIVSLGIEAKLLRNTGGIHSRVVGQLIHRSRIHIDEQQLLIILEVGYRCEQ